MNGDWYRKTARRHRAFSIIWFFLAGFYTVVAVVDAARGMQFPAWLCVFVALLWAAEGVLYRWLARRALENAAYQDWRQKRLQS